MSHHDRHVSADEPSKELEEKVKRHPEDEDVKVDLGSDESMDASDPPSVVQPGSEEEEELPRPHKK